MFQQLSSIFCRKSSSYWASLEGGGRSKWFETRENSSFTATVRSHHRESEAAKQKQIPWIQHHHHPQQDQYWEISNTVRSGSHTIHLVLRIKYFHNHRINDHNQKLRWEITLLIIHPQGTSDISCCFESSNYCYSSVQCYRTNGNQSLIIICSSFTVFYSVTHSLTTQNLYLMFWLTGCLVD